MGILQYPHIGGRVNALPLETAVPFFCPVTCFKQQLAKTVVNPELQVCGLVRIKRVQEIIQPVAVGRECIGYSYITAVGYYYFLCGRIKTALIILNNQSWKNSSRCGSRQVRLRRR